MAGIQLPDTLNMDALFYGHKIELTRHLAKIVKCDETAADLVQESYLILHKASQRQTIEHPRGFLFRIATHLAFNYLRRNKIADTHSQHLTNDDQASPSAEHLVTEKQRLERFVRIVEELPPRCRDVFVLFKVHGMSQKEIAEELGISVSGVEKHIARGLSCIRRQLLAWDGE
ncbi:RNA polymerase sigma factor [Methylosarcina fibrata]|uniref:RNA polymerase sigma factor n=1 Tax=Methylosarcina fibrata TaxID=105972 RepID=UPI00039B97D7|nr:RNA polymerase sigma factor [Methylosarcina fibrata]